VDFRPALVGFGAGGTVIAYGSPLGEAPGVTQPGPPRLALFESDGLSPAWEQSFPEILAGDWCLEHCADESGPRTIAYWLPAAVVAPAGNSLYIVHADAERLTTADLVAGRATTVPVQAGQSLLERLLALSAGTAHAKGPMVGAAKAAVLSSDGARLYVVGETWDAAFDDSGDWESSFEWLDLLEIDALTGRVLGRRPATANELALTPDGKYLVLQSWEAGETRLVKTGGLADEITLAGWQVTPARRVNGSPILLAYSLETGSARMGMVDEPTFEVVHSWPAAGYSAWLAAP
jgi:hypothetical protein